MVRCLKSLYRFLTYARLPYECEGQMTLDEVIEYLEENNPCTPKQEGVS